MAGMVGADPEELDALAQRFRVLAGRLDSSRASLGSQIHNSPWAGPAAQGFRHDWDGHHSRVLTSVARSLGQAADSLVRNANEQRQASGLASAGGSAGATTAQGTGSSSGTGATGGVGGLSTHNVTLLDGSMASFSRQGDHSEYGVSINKGLATAGSVVGVDAYGNRIASAGVAVAAYAGYAAGSMHAGNAYANATARGKAYAGAEANADASGSIGLGGAKGHVGADAFAGVKAEGSVTGTLAGATATAGAEISYGVGAHASADAEFSPTKVRVSVDMGVALGVGAGAKFDVSVNPEEAIANAGHLAADVNEGVNFASGQLAHLLHW